MAITEQLPTATLRNGGTRSSGTQHSIAIKRALQAKRIALKHLPDMIRGLVDLAKTAESEAVRKDCMIYVTERAIGRPAAAPEDAMAAAAAVIQVLSGIARRPTDPVIDVTPQASPELPSKSLISQDISAADQP